MTGREMQEQWRRSLLGFGALLLWSSTVAVARTLSEQVGTFTSAGYSYVLGGLIAMVYATSQRRQRKAIFGLPRGYLVSCGGLFVIYNIALYLAIGLSANRLQLLGIGLINYLWPTFLLIFTVTVLKRKANRFSLGAGLIFSILGAYLAAVHHAALSFGAFLSEMRASPLPYLMASVAAISWGLYSVLNKYWNERHDLSNGHLIVAPVFLVSGLILLALTPFYNESPVWSARAVGELLYLSIFPWLIAYHFWALATQGGRIVFLGVSSMFLPLMSTVVSCLYLSVVPGPLLWGACGLTIAGAALCMRSVSEAPGGEVKEAPRETGPQRRGDALARIMTADG